MERRVGADATAGPPRIQCHGVRHCRVTFGRLGAPLDLCVTEADVRRRRKPAAGEGTALPSG